MFKNAFTVAALAAAMALPVAAFAQPAGTAPPVSADPNSESGASYRATDLLNTQVYGPDNQVVADVEDFVLDSQTNQVQYVVLSYAGVQEAQGQYYVVPFNQFDVRYETDRVYVQTPLTVDVLREAPPFVAAEWGTVVRQPQWRTRVNQYWTGVGVDVNAAPVRQGLRGLLRPNADRPLLNPGRPGVVVPTPGR
jgi:sporulation protein YlmC with PRC-barrel domain